MKKIGLLFVSFFLLLIVFLYFFLSLAYPTLHPLKTMGLYVERIIHPHEDLKSEVVGFLPYWQFDQIKNIQLQKLSEINYFSLTVLDDGHIAKVIDGETDPGWKSWEKESLQNLLISARILGTKTSVTIAALTNETIGPLLENDVNQNNLIQDIVSVVKKSKLDRVNIDVEYSGDPPLGYAQAFTSFSKKLKNELEKESLKTELSLSLMPLSARTASLYEFKELKNIYDHFIGMSYEYYSAGSDIAGPTAPMKGFREKQYFFDVYTTYEDFQKVLPKNKIIMGVPYYGREWAVMKGDEKNSLTFPLDHPDSYAAVISYARARENKELKKNQCSWDELAAETWCWFNDSQSGIDRQLWIADNRSITTRFEYAKKQQLSGVAIWTLGYDKEYMDLWNSISSIFGK